MTSVAAVNYFDSPAFVGVVTNKESEAGKQYCWSQHQQWQQVRNHLEFKANDNSTKSALNKVADILICYFMFIKSNVQNITIYKCKCPAFVGVVTNKESEAG
jgi:hypothetical protein